MQSCEGCHWYGECVAEGKRCKHYYSVEREEEEIRGEYEEVLRERCLDYEELVAEQQG